MELLPVRFFVCESCAPGGAVGVSPPARPTCGDTGGLTSAARLLWLRLCRFGSEATEDDILADAAVKYRNGDHGQNESQTEKS